MVTGQSSCQQCPGGYYCLQNTSDPYSFPCPVGHYCPPGTEFDTQHKCPAGTYNPLATQDNSLACLDCLPGQYCEGEGLASPTGNCSEGWYCTGRAVQAKPVVMGKVTAMGSREQSCERERESSSLSERHWFLSAAKFFRYFDYICERIFLLLLVEDIVFQGEMTGL